MTIGLNPLRARAPVRDFLDKRRLHPGSLVQILTVIANGEPTTQRLPQVTLGQLSSEVKSLYALGIRALKIFVREPKDEAASAAVSPDNVTIQAIKACKDAEPRMAVITETCLCPYTSRGNCVIHRDDGRINLPTTLDLFRRMSRMQAKAGADILGPAAMAEGTVKAIREALNSEGFADIALMPHVEFRSSLYAVYRTLMGTGDGATRHGLQVEVDQGDQFVQAAATMASEGADMLLIEPALFCLDMVSPVARATQKPVGLFMVSGEWMLLDAAKESNLLRDIHLEFLRSAFRSGADFVASYAARDIARTL